MPKTTTGPAAIAGPAALAFLFEPLPPDERLCLRQLPSGMERLISAPFDQAITDEDLVEQSWYHGVTGRNAGGKPSSSTFTFADWDVEPPAPETVYPALSLGVSSGKGRHGYWAWNRPISAAEGEAFSKLVQRVYDSDPAVTQATRIMRTPGSYNRKSATNPKLCTADHFSGIRYDPDEFKDLLVIATAAPYFSPGFIHLAALGLGSVLYRADWDHPRALRLVELLARHLWNEPPNREFVDAIIGTLDRARAGTIFPSGSDLRDAMDGKWRVLLDCAGATARDGDLLLHGQVVGKVGDFDRSLVEAFLSDGDWTFTEGAIGHWQGTHWKVGISPAELTTNLFHFLPLLSQVQNGIERPMAADAKTAKAIAPIIVGDLEQRGGLAELADHFLPVQNGVLDLRTGELFAHDRDKGNTAVSAVSYDPEATCPLWEEYARFSFGEEYYGYLQEWGFYTLYGWNPFQLMLWLVGRSGTGKSTYIDTLSYLLGDLAVALDPLKLGQDTMMAALAGHRMAQATELSTRQLKTANLKALCSGDHISARHLYGRPFTTRYRGKILLGSNGLPPLEEGEGMYRRLAMVTLDNQPDESRYVSDIKVKIWGSELSGVLNWFLGARERMLGYIKTGRWPHPAGVVAKVEEYREMGDSFGNFSALNMEFSPQLRCYAMDVLQAYNVWAKAVNAALYHPGPAFYQELYKAGLRRDVGPKGMKVWAGGKLKAQTFIDATVVAKEALVEASPSV